MANKNKKRMLTLKEKIKFLDWYNEGKPSVQNLATKVEIGKTHKKIE